MVDPMNDGDEERPGRVIRVDLTVHGPPDTLEPEVPTPEAEGEQQTARGTFS